MLSMSTPNRTVAYVVGAVLVLVGILGLILVPNGPVFILFGVDLLHNLVHLVSGILAIALAYFGMARLFNRVFGVVYILLGIVGFFPSLYTAPGLFLGLININFADNFLHLALGIVFAAAGFFLSDEMVTVRA